MKQELTGKKKNTSGFPSKRVFFSENFPESGIYLTNKHPKKVGFPLCGVPLLFCFVAAEHSLLFVIILSES